MADPRICQKCGSPVPIRSPESLCPRCMLMVGLGNGSESSLPEDNPETLVHTAPGKSVLETIGATIGVSPTCFCETLPWASNLRLSFGLWSERNSHLVTESTARSPAAAWGPS